MNDLEELNKAIETLTLKAAKAHAPTEAMQFSQAALNLAHVAQVLVAATLAAKGLEPDE